MSDSRARRWALSPRDMRSHLLADDGSDPIGIVLAVCGHIMPASVDTGPRPTATRCEACEPRQTLDIAQPQFDIAAPQFHAMPDQPASRSVRQRRCAPCAGPGPHGYPQPTSRVRPV